MQTISAFLWFDHEAEEAANFYTSIFPNSKITDVARYPENAPGPAGQVMTVAFELNGVPFTALNGGPQFPFTEAISFVVNCDDQQEIDTFWDALTKEGKEVQCGWLKDKYGMSWQIVPANMSEIMSSPDPEKANAAMQAMLKMTKLNIAELKAAAS